MARLSFGKYSPGEIPDDPKDLARVLKEELTRIAHAMQILVTDAIIFEKLYAQPNKVYEGMIANADGTTWNPGAGAGLYIYRGGVWVLIV